MSKDHSSRCCCCSGKCCGISALVFLLLGGGVCLVLYFTGQFDAFRSFGVNQVTNFQNPPLGINITSSTQLNLKTTVVFDSPTPSATYEMFSNDKNAGSLVNVSFTNADSYFSGSSKLSRLGFSLCNGSTIRVSGKALSLDVQTKVGTVTIKNQTLKSFKSDLAVGDVYLSNVSVGSIDSHINVGKHFIESTTVTSTSPIKISGDVVEQNVNLLNYSDLTVSSNLGSINLALTPSKDSKTTITGKVGKISGPVKSFEGSFDVSSGNGKAIVTNPTTVQDKTKILNGWVTGTVGNGNSSLNVRNEIGNCEMTFQ